MPDPTTPNRPPLSPAAQAVLDACNRAIDREATSLAFDPFREPLTRDIAAAALRAAADQVVLEDELFMKPSKFEADLALEVARNKFFAIAAELWAAP
jgi:hypothetical protein